MRALIAKPWWWLSAEAWLGIRGIPRCRLYAWRSRGADSHHISRAGGCQHRRQDRSEPARGQKFGWGSFHQPRVVLIDPDVLGTLDERELRAGLFESLKCGVIRDKALFEFMERKAKGVLRRDRNSLGRIIVDSVRVKAAVVAADEKESDLRRILNFGHTVGHALESATGYGQFLHGEAVAWGMIAATSIARDLRVSSAETAARSKPQ